MKKFNLKLIAQLFLLGSILIACNKNNYLPLDVKKSCEVSESEFASWFKNEKVTENGFVTPANSVNFVHKTNCDFYKWSQRMFLWMTSNGSYNETVFESPEFYSVMPLVNNQRVLIKNQPGKTLRAMANVDKTGKIVSEEGQATDDVLMDANGNLIYYITMVNDVYAEFLTAVKNKKMSGKTFPTTKEERDSIFNYANENGIELKNSNTLAIEIKTSWAEVSKIKNDKEYITIDALIPVYTKSSEGVWVITGERNAKLALIGMHIVGSANGHPEMIWATFEHKQNTPNAGYQYVNDKGKTITVQSDKGNEWLLNNNINDSSNVSHMTFKNDSIIANKNFTISPSCTVRTKPWGSSTDVKPNAENTSPADSNSEIISINNSVITKLKGNDIRKNYVFIGATWTENGSAPNGYSYNSSIDSLKVSGVAIGTSQLANSTMETYAQNGEKYNPYGSCFSCHSDAKSLRPSSISHIFAKIAPLSKTIKGTSLVESLNYSNARSRVKFPNSVSF
ncbi:hypothetical protein [Flavobacterium sp.]|uniref:hypothetical protein n=1 Tax=Flavobacterium sp. TaxID=239 RepID=UPI00286E982A|nr:hypothetical protein [Flavobacterium sp.]